MEQYELELITRYESQDEELRNLWAQHKEYETYLEKYESKRFLTPQEETELKNLKKEKLAGKTKIQTILEKYRQLEGGDEA